MRDKNGRFIKGNVQPKGNASQNWKGGKWNNKAGYVITYCQGHPKAYENHVYEHVLVAEKKIGRYLEDGEVVHHINGIKDDNRPENIIVCKNQKEHFKNHAPWNRGTKGICKPNSGSFKKGQKSPCGMLGKKHSEESKRKIRKNSRNQYS